jgi:hypothetical protein
MTDRLGGAMVATADTTALRLRLLSIGFTPLPAHGKEIYLTGWASLIPTPDHIASWKRHPDWSNTGIATRHTPAIDIDIIDAAIATVIDNLVFDHFGRAGVILRRVGRAPKRAIIFQASEPFAKRLAVFDAPAADGKLPRIEILASGQQLIAYGIHPDTKRPYLWEPAGPMQVPAKQLPVITAKLADQFLTAATLLLKRQCGWQLKSNPATPATTPVRGPTSYSHQFDVEAVRGILKVVTDAVEGNRNNATFWAACRAGEMVKAGWFTRNAGIDVLLEAAVKAGLSQHAALSTIRSGLRTVGV